MKAKLLFMCVVAAVLTACSGTKDIPEDALLLHRVKVIDTEKHADVNTVLMKQYVKQREQTRWFGFVRQPIVFDSLSAILSCNELRMALNNLGYLDAQVELRTRQLSKHNVDVDYLLHVGEPYYLRNVNYVIEDSCIAELLKDDISNRSLRSGMRFNVENLDHERKRLNEWAINNGYYRFNKEYVSYVADSAVGGRQIDLELQLHKYRRNNLPDTLHQRYAIRRVEFSSGNDDGQSIPLRQSVLHNNTFITPGSWYSARDLQNTYMHFGRLGAVRYTDINFTEVPDTNLLDCSIRLSTNKPRTISFQPEGTNTAGDLGAAATLTYQNRNLFHGSELLSIELRGAYEAIRGLEGYSNQDFIELSAQASLSFPSFIAPFLSSSFRRRINATSEVSLLYDSQNRPEFHRRVLSLAWRYKWYDANHHDRYQIDLLDLNYVFMPWISDTFRSEYLDDTSSRNAILSYNYKDLFIMKTGFGYTYNNGIYAIKANVETAGNLLSLVAGITHAERDEDTGQRQLFHIAYAQYVKGDFEYTRNIAIDFKQQLVFHFGLGLAYPYGNSSILPFEKRYFSGGANSVRGWSVRSLGPGSYAGKDGRIDFINQTGDMKLDLNVEYRAHLFWKLGGALFVDAGNIWTLRNYKDQSGGQFNFKTFLKQLAVGYGLGLRFNFDYFVLRFDLGMKAINPAYESGSDEHFPIIHPKLSRDFAFHFAVGMPF